MQKVNWRGTALIVAMLAGMTAWAVSFLPIFMDQIWGPLWGVEWWPAHSTHSFHQVGPLAGISPALELLAIPIASAFLLVWFILVAALFLLPRRKSPADPH